MHTRPLRLCSWIVSSLTLASLTGCFAAGPSDDEVGDAATAADTTDTAATAADTTDTATTDATDTTATDATDTTTGSDPVCGNGMVELGEECDDGDQDDSDACTLACTLAVCGDLSVQTGAEECDDGNLDDTDACTSECMNAVCGDFLIQAGVEECEDGNMDDSDACVMCLAAVCGDGFVQTGVEACDDGNLVDDDSCSSTCEIGSRTVFVTSSLHTGNLGGLAGADAICTARAAEAGLAGTFKAWLSTDQANGTPQTRFAQSTKPYRRVDGVVIADDWGDLTDGLLASRINVTETGGAAPFTNGGGCNGKGVWTATTPGGTLLDPLRTCNNWTSTFGGKSWGRTDSLDSTWTSGCTLGSPGSPYCSDMAPLYCFQQ